MNPEIVQKLLPLSIRQSHTLAIERFQSRRRRGDAFLETAAMSSTVIKWKGMIPTVQKEDWLCWLAAYEMMFQWKGRPTDWIKTLMYNSIGSSATEEAYAEGLDAPDWPKCANAFGLTGLPGGDVSISDIADLLSNGPLLVHGKFVLGQHSIVVIGVDDDHDWVRYINPYVPKGTEQKVEPRWSQFTYLADGVKGNRGCQAVMQHW